MIVHIFNSALNREARDALLLRHALDDIGEGAQRKEARHELLMARLVRAHWDRGHMSRVKAEYRARFKVSLEDDIREMTRGDFCAFCMGLCET